MAAGDTFAALVLVASALDAVEWHANADAAVSARSDPRVSQERVARILMNRVRASTENGTGARFIAENTALCWRELSWSMRQRSAPGVWVVAMFRRLQFHPSLNRWPCLNARQPFAHIRLPIKDIGHQFGGTAEPRVVRDVGD